jgi:hypothetical protein
MANSEYKNPFGVYKVQIQDYTKKRFSNKCPYVIDIASQTANPAASIGVLP